MTSGPEHFRKSEQFLHRITTEEHSAETAITMAIAAQAHATLAQTAVLALQAPIVLDSGTVIEPEGLPADTYNEWAKVAGGDD